MKTTFTVRRPLDIATGVGKDTNMDTDFVVNSVFDVMGSTVAIASLRSCNQYLDWEYLLVGLMD